jgi:hypothetical protein
VGVKKIRRADREFLKMSNLEGPKKVRGERRDIGEWVIDHRIT